MLDHMVQMVQRDPQAQKEKKDLKVVLEIRDLQEIKE